MWVREYDKASWNGVSFNIVKTADDTGTRLHVEDMPYQDEPFVEVMGSITSPYKITAIFVGHNSLEEANEFKRSLADEPVGYLEHPYLGELNLVYKKCSTSFSSLKKGVVTLTLEFIDQGSEIQIFTSLESIETVQELVLKESAKDFMRQVENSSVTEISDIQSKFTQALNALKKLANQLQTPANKLSALHREISEGLSAISSIVNAPTAFIDQIQSIFKSLVNQTKSLNINEPVSQSKKYNVEKITSKRALASKGVERLVNTQIASQTGSESINNRVLILLFVVTEISLSPTLEDLSADKFETNLNFQNSEMELLINHVESTISLVTQSSSHETLELFEQLQQLKQQLTLEQQKLYTILNNTKTIQPVAMVPTLVIAHQNNTSELELNKLNNFPHPLFTEGKVVVTNE